MCFVYFFWVPVCKFRFRLLRLLGLEQTSNTFHILCGWTNATTGSTWFHNAARSTSQSTIFMMLDFYWCCTQALSSHSIIMWHHPGMITGWCHIIIRHNCGSWRLGLLSRATTRECSNATLFQFRKSGWFKPAWSRSIWSIDAIGFCFARVMWRSMASVLVFFQHILICCAFTCTWSKEVVQTFSQVQQYRLCIRDFTLFVLRMRHICFGGC